MKATNQIKTGAEEHGVPVKPYSMKDLSVMYGVNRKTVQRWLGPFAAEIGVRNGHYYNKIQVEIIFRCLGQPDVEK